MYSLVLVDYNSLEATTAYIARCKAALGTRGASHVVIIENGSNAGAISLLEKEYGKSTVSSFYDRTLYRFEKDGQQICYCHSGENMGYARGNNLGASIAREQWHDPYYIISNNDLFFEKALDLSVVEQLFESHPEIGVIGPQVKDLDGTQQSPRMWQSAFRRLFVYRWVHASGVFLSERANRALLEKYCTDLVPDAPTGPCDWVSGCFFFASAQAFHEAGMFDESTFLYAEEMILSRRMEAVGKTVWFCRELEVLHKHAQTTRSVLSQFRILEIDFQSNWYYFKAYGNTPGIVLLLAKWNYAVYKGLFMLWQQIKKVLKGS